MVIYLVIFSDGVRSMRTNEVSELFEPVTRERTPVSSMGAAENGIDSSGFPGIVTST